MIFSFAKEKSTGAKVYNLGSGTSIDVSHIDGFENFTADNFLIVCDENASATKSNWINHTATFSNNYNFNTYYYAPIKSYDASNGLLTITPAYCYASENALGNGFSKAYPTMKVYLITQKITEI